jgi:hypothetical protein
MTRSKYAELESFHTPVTPTASPPTNESSKEVELKLMMRSNNSVGTCSAQTFTSYRALVSIVDHELEQFGWNLPQNAPAV